METSTAIVVGTVVIVGVVALVLVVQSPPQQMNSNVPRANQSNTTSDVASGITSGLFVGISRLIAGSGSSPSPGSGNASGTRNPNQRGLDTMSSTGSWDGVGNTSSGWYVGPGRT